MYVREDESHLEVIVVLPSPKIEPGRLVRSSSKDSLTMSIAAQHVHPSPIIYPGGGARG